MEERGSKRPRVRVCANGTDVRTRLADMLAAHPHLVGAEVTEERMPVTVHWCASSRFFRSPCTIDLNQAPFWMFAPTFDRLTEAGRELVGLSYGSGSEILSDGGVVVRHVRGLVYRRGTFPVLHDGVQVVYCRGPGWMHGMNAVLVFDTAGLALVDGPFQTAPPAQGAHAERWFRRRWNRAAPGIPAADPYLVLTRERTDLVSILSPLVSRAMRSLTGIPLAAES